MIKLLEVNNPEIINSGGGCMVLQLAVINGEELKAIVLNDEGICGYCLKDPMAYEDDLGEKQLWYTQSWEELAEMIGAPTAVDIHQIFEELYGWPSFIDDEEYIIEEAHGMMNVKVEIMYPVRKEIAQFRVAAAGQMLKSTIEEVDQTIYNSIPAIVNEFPEASEIRWEFADIGQGHYITKVGDQWLHC